MRRERPTPPPPPPPPPKGKDRSDKARPLSKKLSSRKAKESPLKNTPPNEEGKKLGEGLRKKSPLRKSILLSLFSHGLQNSGIVSTEEEEEEKKEEGEAN